MIVDCFVDTNILLYSVSRNPKHLSKKRKAIDLIENQNFAISAQVLQEFYVNATSKADFGMNADAALEWIELLEDTACIGTDASLVKTAIAMSQRYRISYWDGAIIAAAEALGAPILYTEDLNHGQNYSEVTAVNPFLDLSMPKGFHEPGQALFVKD